MTADPSNKEGAPEPDWRVVRDAFVLDDNEEVLAFVVPAAVKAFFDDFTDDLRDPSAELTVAPEPIAEQTLPSEQKSDLPSKVRRRVLWKRKAEGETKEKDPAAAKHAASRIVSKIDRSDFGLEQLDVIAREVLGITPDYETNPDTGEDEPHYSDE